MLRLLPRGSSGRLSTSEFDLMDGDVRLGFGQIRHVASHSPEVPAHMASHVYYEIDIDHRGRGYGKQLLGLLIQKAKKLGITEVILTCYEDNPASKKIIESHGGVFLEDAMIPAHGKRLLKYRITL